jgi:hypothetical protein
VFYDARNQREESAMSPDKFAFDVCVVGGSNFLERLPDKAHVQRAAEARRCLPPGGALICLGPNLRYVHGAYWLPFLWPVFGAQFLLVARRA